MAKRICYVKKKNILNLGHIDQKDSLLLLKLQVNLCQKLFFLRNMGRTSCVQKLCPICMYALHVLPRFELGIFIYWICNSLNNLSTYCGLVDAKIRASDKDLPVQDKHCKSTMTVTVTMTTFIFGLGFEKHSSSIQQTHRIFKIKMDSHRLNHRYLWLLRYNFHHPIPFTPRHFINEKWQ